MDLLAHLEPRRVPVNAEIVTVLPYRIHPSLGSLVPEALRALVDHLSDCGLPFKGTRKRTVTNPARPRAKMAMDSRDKRFLGFAHFPVRATTTRPKRIWDKRFLGFAYFFFCTKGYGPRCIGPFVRYRVVLKTL